MILGMSEVSLRRVGPDEWQDRRGYGVSDAVVREVLDWARDQRFGRVDLWVLENNQAARRLYRRHGFVDTGSYMPYPYAPHRGCASNR